MSWLGRFFGRKEKPPIRREPTPEAEFGCENCWPTPDAAWEARQSLAREADLIDVPELIGATLRGIYEIDTDQLRICYGPPGGDRARGFSGDSGTEQYLAEYRRI